MTDKRKGLFVTANGNQYKIADESQKTLLNMACILVTHVVNYSTNEMYIDILDQRKYIPLNRIESIDKY